jgi:hypothetical protein
MNKAIKESVEEMCVPWTPFPFLLITDVGGSIVHEWFTMGVREWRGADGRSED